MISDPVRAKKVSRVMGAISKLKFAKLAASRMHFYFPSLRKFHCYWEAHFRPRKKGLLFLRSPWRKNGGDHSRKSGYQFLPSHLGLSVPFCAQFCACALRTRVRQLNLLSVYYYYSYAFSAYFAHMRKGKENADR